ncbi:MAG: TonB family protein [Deltaproteobacteria bacterium]|nr:TonB family protein [Deltaproteobacteria bacterium]
MPARTHAPGHRRDDDSRILVGMIGLSVLCHLIFFSGVLFVPYFRSSKSYIPSAVEVDLVSLPQSGPRPSTGVKPVPPPKVEKKEAIKPAEKVKPPPEVKQKPVQTKSEEVVSVAPKKVEVKKSVKHKTYDASKAIKSAIAKIEKEAPKSRQSSVQRAIDKFKQDVEGKDGVVMQGRAGQGAGKKALDLLDIYNAEIWHQIQKNWAFSEEMARGLRDLEATIVVKIMKEGEIRDIWFERRSGNSYFDDSALKAVKKADPLPPLPKGYTGSYYEVGFRFNLSELQQGF